MRCLIRPRKGAEYYTTALSHTAVYVTSAVDPEDKFTITTVDRISRNIKRPLGERLLFIQRFSSVCACKILLLRL